MFDYVAFEEKNLSNLHPSFGNLTTHITIGGVNGGGGTGVGGNSETFQIGASSRQNFSGNSHYVTNNNSRGPLYITKPPQQHGLHAANNGNMPQNSRNGFNQLSRNGNGGNGYIPSVYSNNPNTRPSSNRVISTQNGLHGKQILNS